MKKLVLAVLVVFNLSLMTAAAGMIALKNVPDSWQLAATATAINATKSSTQITRASSMENVSISNIETASSAPAAIVGSPSVPVKDAVSATTTTTIAPASGAIPIHIVVGPARPAPSLACLGASSAISFVQPYAGATYNQGGVIPVGWAWTNPNPAPDTSIYLIPQSGGAPILYSQYSMATNISTNGQLRITAINGSDVQSRIPLTVPAGQYRMKIVNGTQFMGCSGTFAIAAAPICTPTFGYLSQIGTQGAGNGQFNATGGVAVDNPGNIYITDVGNSRIEKFSSGGTYLTQWGSSGNGNSQFGVPIAIVADSSGNIYVSDIHGSVTHTVFIKKFSSTGTFLASWPLGTGQVDSLAVDSAGNIYALDMINNNVRKFSPAGNVLLQFGSSGSGNGQFISAAGIVVDTAGNIYIADQYNARIQKFSSTGQYLVQWGTYGHGNSQMIRPLALAKDLVGNIYVGDNYIQRMQEFSPSGQYIAQWGSAGSGNGQFNGILNMTSDSTGNIYIADSLNNRVQKFGMSKCIQS